MNTHNNDNVTQLAKRRFVDVWRKYWTLFQRECDLEEQFDTAIMLGRPVQRIKNSMATVSKKRNELDHDMEDLYIELQFPEHMNELCESEFDKAGVEHDLYGAISDLHGDTYQEHYREYADYNAFELSDGTLIEVGTKFIRQCGTQENGTIITVTAISSLNMVNVTKDIPRCRPYEFYGKFYIDTIRSYYASGLWALV